MASTAPERTDPTEVRWRRGLRVLAPALIVGGLAAACLPPAPQTQNPPAPPAPANLVLTTPSTSLTDELDADPGPTTITYLLTNNGPGRTGALTQTLVPTGAGTWTATGCTGSDLASGQSCNLSVSYTATAISGTAALDLSLAGALAGSVSRAFTGTNRASLVVSPTSATLNAPSVGADSAAVQFTIANNAANAIQFVNVSVPELTGDGTFDEVSRDCPVGTFTLNGQSACHVVVKYHSTGTGIGGGRVVADSVQVTAPAIATLSGTTG